VKRQIIISISTLFCRLMACLRVVKFDGSTGFTDSHDAIQREVGNFIWFSEFVTCGEDRIAEVLIWVRHSVGLCCTIAGEYAMYIGGKLASRPQSIALYIACPLKRGLPILPCCCKSNRPLLFH